MSIAAANTMFGNYQPQFIRGFQPSGGLGFSAQVGSGMASFDMMSFLKMMQFMQMLQSGFAAFGGQGPMSPIAPQSATVANPPMSPQGQIALPSPNSTWNAASTTQNHRPSSPEENKRIENQLENLSSHWVKVLPGGHSNPQGLMMRLNKGGVTVPYDPNTEAKDINLLMLDSNHLPAAGIHNIEKYWEARSADGVDRSILAEAPRFQGQDASIQERYNDNAVRRMMIDGTASEIYPGEHVPHGATNSRIHKDHVANYSSLNSFSSKRHEEKSLEEQQNLHESAKFAIASATFLESGGSFDDRALDMFLSENLKIADIKSETADGPRGKRLAKLGEVTRAIIDGEIDIEDAVESGIVPKDQVKKFEASLLSVESGKIGADVSEITEKSTNAEVKETVAKSITVGSPSNPVSRNVIRKSA